jgi:hypothetical protein
MTEVQQVREDLRFVRDAVDRRAGLMGGYAIAYYMWAAYVLIGYILIDVNSIYANWFFVIGGIVAAALSGWYGKRARQRRGVMDRARALQNRLHWGGGIVGSIMVSIGLGSAIPTLRGPVCGQITVVMIGMVYFLWGVHRDRSFLWLGPVLMVGGVMVGVIPRYPWTCLGAVIALGLVTAGILAQRSAARRAVVQ